MEDFFMRAFDYITDRWRETLWSAVQLIVIQTAKGSSISQLKELGNIRKSKQVVD